MKKPLELRTAWDQGSKSSPPDYGPWGHNFVTLVDVDRKKALCIHTGAGDYWFNIQDLGDDRNAECWNITARWREVGAGGGQSKNTYYACSAFIQAARRGDTDKNDVTEALPVHHAFSTRRKDDETAAWLKLDLDEEGGINIRLHRGKFWDTLYEQGTLSFAITREDCPPALYKTLVDMAYAMLLDNNLVMDGAKLRPLKTIEDRYAVNSTDRFETGLRYEYGLPGWE